MRRASSLTLVGRSIQWNVTLRKDKTVSQFYEGNGLVCSNSLFRPLEEAEDHALAVESKRSLLARIAQAQR